VDFLTQSSSDDLSGGDKELGEEISRSEARESFVSLSFTEPMTVPNAMTIFLYK
jgi:hypothetical protein